jgi:hypothetical protein
MNTTYTLVIVGLVILTIFILIAKNSGLGARFFLRFLDFNELVILLIKLDGSSAGDWKDFSCNSLAYTDWNHSTTDKFKTLIILEMVRRKKSMFTISSGLLEQTKAYYLPKADKIMGAFARHLIWCCKKGVFPDIRDLRILVKNDLGKFTGLKHKTQKKLIDSVGLLVLKTIKEATSWKEVSNQVLEIAEFVVKESDYLSDDTIPISVFCKEKRQLEQTPT